MPQQQQPDDDDAAFEAWKKKKRANVTAPTDTASDDDAEFAAWKAARGTTDSLPRLDPARPVTPPSDSTPAPRRGIAGALGDLIDDYRQRPRRAVGGGLTGGNADKLPQGSIYDQHRETRTIEHAPVTPPSEAEQFASLRRLPTAQRADVSDAAGVARTRGPSPTQPTQTVAEDRQRRLTVAQNRTGAEKANFSPERWREIADAGDRLAEDLLSQGKSDEATDVARKARNARLLSENSQEADTFGAIALSNLLGIVKDPYEQQRRNIAEAAQPGATFSPEETAQLGEDRVAPARGFDTSKDLAAPLVGQLPVFAATGAAGRLATGAAGAFAEARGARSIGQALTRLSQLGSEAEAVGPRVPIRTIPLAQARVAEEVAQFRAAVPAMVARGVTEGQAVGAVLTYKQARDQGASVEDALAAAAEGVPLNILMGVAGETLISGAGKALGLGYDPVGRVLKDVRQGIGLELPEPREVARPVDRRVDVQQREIGAQRANVASALDEILNEKIRTSRGESPRPLGPEEPTPPMVEGVEGFRRRGAEANTPLRSARDVAMERAGGEERATDQFNAVRQMEREREALREQTMAEATDPNLRLELAAQEAPDRVQGPRTLRETLADLGPASEQGDELAAGYTKAINDYVDTLSAVRDAGEEGPNTRLQVKLARARAALDAARQSYGTQIGASAVLALAATQSDLTDEEKAAVGLAAVPLLLRSAKEHLGLPRERINEIREAIVRPEDGVYGMGVQPWMDRIRAAAPELQQQGALTRIEEELYNRARTNGTTGGTLTPSEVQAALTPPESVAREREPLYSRLATAIEDRQQFPKKWDDPRPAADWIGKLKGSNTFSKRELELILPILENAQAAKVKIDRATMQALVEDHVPRIERTTLQDVPRKKSPSERAAEGGGDPDDIIDLDELEQDHADSPDVLQAQIENRQAKIREIESLIEARIDEARQEMDFAEEEVNRRIGSIQDTLREAGIATDMMDSAMQYIDEHVESEYVPRGVVEKAWDKVWEDISSELESRHDREELLTSEGYSIEEEPQWRVTVRTDQNTSRRIDLSAEDLGFSKREIDRGITEEQVKAKITDRYGDDLMDYEPWDELWVVRDKHGNHINEAESKDAAMQDAVDSEGLGPDNGEVLSELKSDLERYADDRANWMSKESEHYYFSEQTNDAFDTEMQDKETIESEISSIEELIAQAEERMQQEQPLDRLARAGVLAAGGEDPALGPVDPEAHLLEPVTPTVKGSTKYASYQRIGGGRNYRELLNQWENKPGTPYSRNHYGNQGFANTVGHVRAEDHTVVQYPGVSGDKIEISGSEPQEVRDVKSKIVDLRKQREKFLSQMQALVDQHEAMPPAEREGAAAHALAQQYGELNQRAIDVTKEEDRQLAKLGALTDSGAQGKDIAVMVESQSDWSQDATKFGVQQAPDPARAAALEQEMEPLRKQVEVLEREWEYANNIGIERAAQWGAKRSILMSGKPSNELRELADDFSRAMHRYNAETAAGVRADDGYATPDISDISLGHLVQGDEYRAEREWLMTDPRTAQLVNDYIDAHFEVEANRLERQRIGGRLQELRAEYEMARGATGGREVPASPFIDTQVAHTLNAARFLIDAVERGHSDIAVSDAANRMKNAHLPFAAANLTYNEIVPNAINRLLGGLGFKGVKPDKVYIRGEGHWHWELTPEMRKAIRRYGLPILGVMALMPSTAEAQGENSVSASPYLTTLGGIAIGAALMHIAKDRAARRIVHEHREFARMLQMDDLSGLANKRAFERAKANVDADENYGWVVADGDRFKQVNDKLGHSTGDKAIQHFGEVMRQAADELDIPLRAFRLGGDEFAFAVPKEVQSRLVRYLEQHSEFSRGGVTTKLSAGMGDSFEEADAALIALKAERKKADPSLRREGDSPLGGATLYANPVGPALRAIAKYPTAASIAALGVALGESDDPDLKATSPYMIGLAALSAIGSHNIIKGKDALVKATVEMMQKVGGEGIVRAFNPDALLHPSVKNAIEKYERDRARAAARAKEFASKSAALGPEGDRAVSDILENEGWEDTSNFTAEQMKDVLAVAAAIDAEYQQAAQEQLATGARTPEQLLEPYGGPRRYAAIEAEQAQRDRPGYQPSRSTRIGELKRRTLDVPVREAEQALAAAQATGDPAQVQAAQDALDEARMVQMSRRTELGEIREQSYRASQGIEQGYANAAAARLFTALRNIPGVVHPEFLRLTDELKAAKQMLATATTQADRDAAQTLVQSATYELDKLTKEFQRKDGAYVSLADSKGLGELRGAIVKRDVAHSITGFSDNTTYKKLLRQWKELKTVFNVGTHIANVVSNFTFAHMEGLLLHQQPAYLKRALGDMKKYGDATRALAEAGILDQNVVTADGSGYTGREARSIEGMEELRRTTRPETRTVLEDHGVTAQSERARKRKARLKGAAIGGAVGAAALASAENPEDAGLGAAIGAGVGALAAGRGRSLRKLYNNEDNIFRVAIYLKKLDDGMSKDDALRYTQSALGHFRTRSPALNLARTTVAPFILYPAKAVPRFARQMIDHPWRYVALMAAWGALNEYAERDVGEIPDSDLGIKDRTQSKWGYFFPGFTQLPTVDEQGNRGATDIARWTPMSGVSTGTPPGSVTGTLSERLPAIMQPSGPVLDAAAKLYGNVDPTTGRSRIKRDYPVGENIATLLNDASEMALPPALGFHRARLQEDIENRDFAKFRTDVLGPTGLRPRFVRPGANIRAATFQLTQSLRDMEYEFERATINNKDQSPERRQSLLDRYLRRREQAISNFVERTGTTPPGDIVR